MKTRKTVVGAVDPEVLAFTVGKDAVLDLQLVEWDCIGSAAHVTMLASSLALFSPKERDAIILELVNVIRLGRDGKFRITLQDQDVHLAVERHLTQALGEPGKRIHTARSRNDQVATDLRLHGKHQLFDVIDETVSLARALLTLGRRHARVPMVGRTHLQPAMPSSVGLWAASYAESLLDDLIVVDAALTYTDRCPLGFAASYGVPLPIDRTMTSNLLGFAAPQHAALHAANARGKTESIILNALAQLMLTLSRMAEDLILYAMPEFGYFSFPSEYGTGSSIMPQKNNPDVLELVRAKAGRLQGYATSVNTVIKALPGGYSRDLQEIKEPYLEGMATTRASLRIMATLIQGVGVNRQALADGFTPAVFAADRAYELVGQGMPFRDAYHYVREHLDELETIDPHAAVAAKTHLGAPAGVDFKALGARATVATRDVATRRRQSYRAIGRLLGVPYPDLDA